MYLSVLMHMLKKERRKKRMTWSKKLTVRKEAQEDKEERQKLNR